MSRRYDDAVDVRRHDDRPGGFVWRGRRYAVRAVLGHWCEAGAWWRVVQGGPERPAPGLDDRERELWRVEASSPAGGGGTNRVGTYDLCFDWSGGRWTVVRSYD